MNRSNRLPPGLGAMLSAAVLSSLAGDDAEIPGMTKLELDGEGSLDEQLGRAIDAAAAKHRETCSACRELYEENAPKATNPEAELDARREKLKAAHDAQRRELALRHDAEREKLEADLADMGEQKGFMLFNAGEPLPESFNTDRGVLEEVLGTMDRHMADLLRTFGVEVEPNDLEIREVTQRTTEL